MSQYMVARERPDGSGIDYPPLLPSDRKRRAEDLICMLIIVLMSAGAVSIWNDSGLQSVLWYTTVGFSFSVFIIGLVHLVLRLCLLIEEIHHCPARYPDFGMAAVYAFTMNTLTKFTYVISTTVFVLTTLIGGETPLKPLWQMGAVPNLMVFAASYCFAHLIRMEESTLNISLQIMRLSSLDYGSGMAYNFFYGYLRLVLSTPERGDNGANMKGITGRIESYASKHGLIKTPDDQPFPVKKLFILIPHNLYTPTDLKEVSCDDPNDRTICWMEAAQSLETQELDRAGVKKRAYKNSVYKIRDPYAAEETPYTYVVAEGATPLKTLYDVIEMNRKMSDIFKKHKEEIVSSFYKTLLNILDESEECRGLCEVIYYVDTDANKRKVNVAKIILERINELQRSYEQRNGN